MPDGRHLPSRSGQHRPRLIQDERRGHDRGLLRTGIGTGQRRIAREGLERPRSRLRLGSRRRRLRRLGFGRSVLARDLAHHGRGLGTHDLSEQLIHGDRRDGNERDDNDVLSQYLSKNKQCVEVKEFST